jgi:hypothetical protein
MSKSPAWTRKEGQNPEGGLNARGRASARSQGMNLQPPAPKPKNKRDAARRRSFCARMQGMKKKLTSEKTKRDPDSRINKSLRAWNCGGSKSTKKANTGGQMGRGDGVCVRGKTRGLMT